MKKEKKVLKRFFLFFSVIFFGLLLGYYFVFPSLHKQTSNVPLCDALTNITPASGTEITSPLTVSVIVDNTKSCKWTVFEAQAGTITLQDNSGMILGKSNLTTTEGWMTDKPVHYTGTITFTKPKTNKLLLTITEENPSGKEGKTITIPLK